MSRKRSKRQTRPAHASAKATPRHRARRARRRARQRDGAGIDLATLLGLGLLEGLLDPSMLDPATRDASLSGVDLEGAASGTPVGLQVDLRTGRITTSTTSADPAVYRAYLEDHKLLPKAIERWSEQQLRELFEVAALTGREKDWQRALIFAAHHQSEFAARLLSEQQERAPGPLRSYWELAYSEAVGWLGYDYHGDRESPVAVPAGSPAPTGEAN